MCLKFNFMLLLFVKDSLYCVFSLLAFCHKEEVDRRRAAISIVREAYRQRHSPFFLSSSSSSSSVHPPPCAPPPTGQTIISVAPSTLPPQTSSPHSTNTSTPTTHQKIVPGILSPIKAHSSASSYSSLQIKSQRSRASSRRLDPLQSSSKFAQNSNTSSKIFPRSGSGSGSSLVLSHIESACDSSVFEPEENAEEHEKSACFT